MAEFGHQTPRLLKMHFDGWVKRQHRAARDRAWVAYHVALLPRLRTIPPLEELVPQAARLPEPEQGDDEIERLIEAWARQATSKAERPAA